MLPFGLIMVVVGTVNSFILPFPTPFTTTQPQGCLVDGNLHPPGSSWNPSPCQSCTCLNGQPYCIYGDCSYPLCTDWVYRPDRCCPVCTDGKTCNARYRCKDR